MNNKVKNILLKLNNGGFKAYIVGGFVRDYILGNQTYDVDIATDALSKDVIDILNINISNDDNYGSIRFKDSLYNYDITTFRKEIKYENRKPVEIEFAKTIEDDIVRRDFTINSLYMDSTGKIYDLLNGQEDIFNKVIKVIGNINDKMVEDPLRILRAIRFVGTLGFDLDDNLSNYIKQNKIIIKTISNTRKKDELDNIFKSKYKEKALKLIKELDIEDELEIKIRDNITYTDNNYGIWAQIEYSKNYQFSSKEDKLINDVRSIISYGMIDNIVLYQYGLYSSVIAGEILNLDTAIISDIYKNLPIYSIKDINISGDDIINLLNIEPGEKIKQIMNDLEIRILNNLLINKKEDIEEYILNNWR